MYKAVLFAPDGDWVTDYRGSKTIAEVEEKLADQGSRWFFYPFHAVIIDHGSMTRSTQRLVDVAYPFEEHKGHAIHTFTKFLRACDEDYLRAVLEG